MAYEQLSLKSEQGILEITIQRPEQLNALNKATIQELNKALSLAEYDESVRVIILTGAGEKAFVAGADIKEFADFGVHQGRELSETGHKLLFDFIENMSKPVIAAINGFALGGGLELAMSCHMRIASDNAIMGLPETSLGLIPGYGGTQRLAALIGKGRAFEMISAASKINATEAYRMGLINAIHPQAELLAQARELAGRIMRNSPKAIEAAIRCLNDFSRDGVNGFRTEIREFGYCFGTADFKEGVGAFLEKRKPHFTGK
ncbi:MAG: enoyl-CoA hydratase/isomerase family protein [Flavobacteriales bacterium]